MVGISLLYKPNEAGATIVRGLFQSLEQVHCTRSVGE